MMIGANGNALRPTLESETAGVTSNFSDGRHFMTIGIACLNSGQNIAWTIQFMAAPWRQDITRNKRAETFVSRITWISEGITIYKNWIPSVNINVTSESTKSNATMPDLLFKEHLYNVKWRKPTNFTKIISSVPIHNIKDLFSFFM